MAGVKLKKQYDLIMYGLMSIALFVFAGCNSVTSSYQNNENNAAASINTPIPSVNERHEQQKNQESITKEDENAVHDLIVAYFKAIENKDYSAAWGMLSSDRKKSFSMNDANQEHFGIESVKLISIQTYLRPQEPIENENKPTTNFIVKLDIVPNQYGSWGKGMNERFVGAVKEQGQWKIKSLATSP